MITRDIVIIGLHYQKNKYILKTYFLCRLRLFFIGKLYFFRNIASIYHLLLLLQDFQILQYVETIV